MPKLILEKNEGNLHVEMIDTTDKAEMQDMLEVAANEIGVSTGVKKEVMPAEIVFHNRQRIGDMLMFTCGVRDFKAAFPKVRVNVISIAPHIFDHNPNIDRTLIPTEANTIKIGPGKLTNSSNRIDWHFTNAFRVSMEEALKVSIPQGESRPDIYLTQEEYDAPRIFEGPYWVICITGEKGWGCKMYPAEKWQEFVNQNPGITFVQIGAKEDNPPRLRGENVIDYVGQTQSKDTGIRDLYKLFLNAEGSIGLVSFHMHLSGAFNKPCVVVAGAREPVHFTRYPGHAYLATDGMLPCATKACWHCDIKACTNPVEKEGQVIPKCVDMIEPSDLTRALNNYYIGGRLVKGKASEKPKFKNVVKTPPKVVVAPVEPVNTYGLPWGGGSITDKDWEFIKKTIKDYNVKTVLEFGAGLSTLLLNDICRVLTLETNQQWIDRVKAINAKAEITHWDGQSIFLDDAHFDLAFVDGPANDKPREASTKAGAEYSDIVIVHDANREWALKYQEQYLKPTFHGPIKGGHRCHLWVKTKKIPTIQEIPEQLDYVPENKVVNPKAKTVKIVSTARGWGGCARSVTTIMELLINAGHKVEFIPFRNAVSSSEFKAILKGDLKDVKVTENYSTINEPCDVLLMYADDYVWDFVLPIAEKSFSDIKADRKIMMLNYRRGKVGEVPWTRGWDKYMFLNGTQEQELLKVHPGVKTKVLPPCTDLSPFFEVTPNYEGNIKVVRHSSQGDTKFSKDFQVEVDRFLLVREDLELAFLPGPSFIQPNPRVIKTPRTADPKVIAQFLSCGNLFWYSLPKGYMDQGPRVILEAMAAGLPILADSWGGAVDRVTPECGWLFSEKEDHAEILKSITSKELKQKGESSREHARANFSTQAWLNNILGD